MLSAIKALLMEVVNMSDAPKDRAAERWKQIEQFLEDHDVIQNADVRCLSGDSQSHPCETRGRRKIGEMPQGWTLDISKEGAVNIIMTTAQQK